MTAAFDGAFNQSPVIIVGYSGNQTIHEDEVVKQIVAAIQHGYIKKPWASITGAGHVTVRCKLKYMKHGNRAIPYGGGPWKDAFRDLFIRNHGTGPYSDDALRTTEGVIDLIRNRVVAELGEKTVKNFCSKIEGARAKADIEGARKKHKKNMAKRRFKARALEAAKEGLSRDELVCIIDEAIINDVMTE